MVFYLNFIHFIQVIVIIFIYFLFSFFTLFHIIIYCSSLPNNVHEHVAILGINLARCSLGGNT